MPQLTVACNDENLRIGESHQNAKLTNSEVDLMRALHESGTTIKELARMFETSRGTVHDIVNYRRRGQTPTRFRTINVAE